MSWYTRWDARRRGRADADAGVEQAEEFVQETLGPRPVWDPVGRHALVVEGLGRGIDIAERDAIMRETRVGREHSFPRWLYLTGAVAAWLIEAVALIQLLRAEGVEAPWRVPLGLMLAAFAIAITYAVARVAEQIIQRRAAWPLSITIIVIATYLLLLGGIGFARFYDVDPDGGWRSWAMAILMLCATLGPAWIAEHLLHLYRSATRPGDVLRTLGRERDRLARDHARATRTHERVQQAVETWDREATRLRAAYTNAFRRRQRENQTHEKAPGRLILPPRAHHH